MQHNPYSPPESSQAEVRDLAPRPISVWILVLLLLAITTAFSVGAARFLWFVVSHLTEVHSFSTLAIAVIWRVAVVPAALATMLGIFHRRQWARWLGILAIAALAALSILAPDDTQYANDAERGGGFVARSVIIPLVLAWWGYAFGLSTKSRRYFESRSILD